MMRVAFLVGDVRSQEPAWTTVYLALAALRCGHDVGFIGVDELTLTPSGDLRARVVRPPRGVRARDELCAVLADKKAPALVERLAAWDVVFLRYHPIRERAVRAPELGERLRAAGVVLVNDPEGMQRAGGRTYLAALPDEIRPRTLVTRDPDKVKAFLRKQSAIVVKPLLEKAGGMENVFVVRHGQKKNLNQILEVLRKGGYIMAQEYLPAIARGEKRLLLLDGEPIRIGERVAIYRRVRENGSTSRRRCSFGAVEQRIVDQLRPRLRGDGLHLVGVDIVGDKVLQVNVFTPGGAQGNHDLYGIDVAEPVVRDLERRVRREAVA
jgi:glutathione synthase